MLFSGDSILSTARRLIRRHGGNASSVAQDSMWRAEETGDRRSAQRWLEIIDAIEAGEVEES